MSAKYQTQFEINRVELDIIEKALRHQAQTLYQKTIDEQGAEEQVEPVCEDYVKTRMTAIQSVLGKLHNQKMWFVPKELVPLG